MRNLKRVLSLGLASVMLMGMMVVGAGAASSDFTDASEIKNVEAVDVMVALGVLEGGDKGDFQPNSILTREQAAKIICYLLLGTESAEKLTTNSAVFSDVAADRWSAPYIGYCVNMGILAGDGNGHFFPEGKLTGAAFAKMLLVALGYDASIEKYVGSDWMINVASDAIEAGISPSGVVLSDELSRQDAAQMAFQTLTANMVKYDNKGADINFGGGNSVSIGASSASTITAASGVNYDKTSNTSGDTVLQFCEKYFSKLTKGTGVDTFGRSGDKWTYNGDEIGVYGKTADDVVVADEAIGSNLRTFLRDKLDNDKLENTNATYYFNGDPDESATEIKAAGTGTVLEIFYDEGDSDKITRVVAYQYTLEQVEEVDTDVTDADAKDGVSAYVYIDGTKYNNTDVAGYIADDYVEDAYVAVIVKGSKVIASYIPEVVEGTITTKNNTNKTVTVDGTKYTAASNMTSGVLTTDIDSTLAIGSDNTYALYLDNNGYVMGIDKVEGSDPTIDDVYYVALVWKETNAGSYGGSNVTSYYAQLVSLDGTVSEVELESKDVANDGNTYLDNKTDFEGKLVTTSDKKWTDAADATHKANDDKYDLTLWNGGSDWDVVNHADAATKYTKSMTRLVVDGKTYRLNSETKYVLASETGSDLVASVVTGGVAYDATGKAVSLITADGSTTVKYVVIGSTTEINQAGDFSSDLIYIAKVNYDEGDGYVTQEVYFSDGSKKTINIDLDDDNSTVDALAVGFYAYDTNDDGYYVLSDDSDVVKALTLADTTNHVWDEDEGVLTGAAFVDLYEDLLSVTTGDGANKFNDINVADAAFVDVHDTDAAGQYDRTVNSLSALKALADKDNYTTSATLALNVDENGAVTIFVTNLTHTKD